MNNGIYAICKDEDTIVTEYCESWFKLIQFIEKYQDNELYCTSRISEWYDKLREWRDT